MKFDGIVSLSDPIGEQKPYLSRYAKVLLSKLKYLSAESRGNDREEKIIYF